MPEREQNILTKVHAKLDSFEKRFEEIERQLADPEAISDSSGYARILKEHGKMKGMMEKYRQLKQTALKIDEARNIIQDPEQDADFKELARSELAEFEAQEDALIEEILALFVAQEESPSKSIILEIRAGTGGEEAALFAGDLFRMYAKYAERQGWKLEMLSASPTDLGGFKEVIFSLTGKDVYHKIQYEGGGHRVQRIPATETSGRIHTSAATVAVLPEPEDIEVNINPSELRVDTMRSSGPGGQNVNKLNSAVRIVHLPTGITVQCQDEKSQHKNRAKAMRILKSRLYNFYESEKRAERESARNVQIGTGDRSDRVRTYNFHQNRVSDHRINLTLHNLENVMLGELEEFIKGLITYHKEKKLVEMLE